MKDFQVPKFAIGDVVWRASSDWNATQIPCPDCLGDKHWMVRTPAGENFLTFCRTCWHGFDGCCGTVSQYDYTPQVRRLTVGLVTTRQSDVKTVIQYMCEETGIGSGTVWNEESVFSTEKEARVYADRQAQAKRLANPQGVEEDRKRQLKKASLVMEPNPRKVMEDEINQLKQQVKELKKKPGKRLTKPSS